MDVLPAQRCENYLSITDQGPIEAEISNESLANGTTGSDCTTTEGNFIPNLELQTQEISEGAKVTENQSSLNTNEVNDSIKVVDETAAVQSSVLETIANGEHKEDVRCETKADDDKDLPVVCENGSMQPSNDGTKTTEEVITMTTKGVLTRTMEGVISKTIEEVIAKSHVNIEGLDDEMRSILDSYLSVPNPCPDLNDEERQLKERLYGIGNQSIQYAKIHCTACNKHLGSALGNGSDRFVHPLMHTIVCKSCFNFYTSGEFEKDEDGSELYCRWCGQGGKVLCCAQCSYVFCTRCIKNNFGKKRLDVIKTSDNWLCFLCDRIQTISQRVTCHALFDYLKTESKRVATLNDPSLITFDHSLCCKLKKRKWDEDHDYEISEEWVRQPKRRKIAKPAHARAPPKSSWTPEGDEEEVVCAPDLLILMDGDDMGVPEIPKIDEDSPILNQVLLNAQNSLSSCSSAVPRAPFAKRRLVAQKAPTVRPIVPKLDVLPPPLAPMSTNGHKTVPLPNPPQSTKICLDTMGANTLSHEWFERAAKATAKVHTKLACGVARLGEQQRSVRSVEELAKVHNRLQEVLSASINSLIQVRRNLRTEFLGGLHKLKFARKPADNNKRTVQAVDPLDNDVIFVNEAAPPPAVVETVDLRKAPTKRDNKSGPYLKVRSVAQLANVPSECITIVDDVNEKEAEGDVVVVLEAEKGVNEKKERESGKAADVAENGDSNKENVEKFTENSADAVEVELTPEIRMALFESKMEKIVSDNLRYNIKGIPDAELKKMLSVRVYVKKKLTQGSAKSSVEMESSVKSSVGKALGSSVQTSVKNLDTETFVLQDFEAMLDSSIVRKKTSNVVARMDVG